MITYELAKQLKDARFPHKFEIGDKYFEGQGIGFCGQYSYGDMEWATESDIKIPTLSELIEACGDKFKYLEFVIDGGIDGKEKLWWAYSRKEIVPEAYEVGGSTPEESVAKLWLELNK